MVSWTCLEQACWEIKTFFDIISLKGPAIQEQFTTWFQIIKIKQIYYKIKACLWSNFSVADVTMLTAKNSFEERAIRIENYSAGLTQK